MQHLDECAHKILDAVRDVPYNYTQFSCTEGRTSMTLRGYNSERVLNIPDREESEILYCAATVKILPNVKRRYGYLKSKRFEKDAILGVDVIMAYGRIAAIVLGARIRVAARFDSKSGRYHVIRIESVVPT